MVMLGKISTRETGEARGAVRVNERIVKSVRERDHRWGNVLANFYVLFTGSHLHLDSWISSERGNWHGNLSNGSRALSRNIEVERNIQDFTFVWSGSNLGPTSRSKLLPPCVHTRKEHSKRLLGFLSRRKVVFVILWAICMLSSGGQRLLTCKRKVSYMHPGMLHFTGIGKTGLTRSDGPVFSGGLMIHLMDSQTCSN